MSHSALVTPYRRWRSRQYDSDFPLSAWVVNPEGTIIINQRLPRGVYLFLEVYDRRKYFAVSVLLLPSNSLS